MWKRLFFWMPKARSDKDQQLGLPDLFEEVSAVRKTLRKQTVLLEDLHQGLAALVAREGKKEIGPLLDCADGLYHLDQALRAGEEFSSQLDQALQMVWEKLDEVLDGAGVAMIREQGVVFDAHRHEAIEKTGTDAGQLWVLRVVQPGYAMEGQVIRAAKTIVGAHWSTPSKSEGLSE